jgi:hypothetical protein
MQQNFAYNSRILNGYGNNHSIISQNCKVVGYSREVACVVERSFGSEAKRQKIIWRSPLLLKTMIKERGTWTNRYLEVVLNDGQSFWTAFLGVRPVGPLLLPQRCKEHPRATVGNLFQLDRNAHTD